MTINSLRRLAHALVGATTGCLRTLDGGMATASRQVARRTSRRGVISRLGVLLVGAGAMPLLPVARAAGPDLSDPGNPESCDYWRHCAIDGFLCSCCGGTVSSCPPGAEPSPITWLGTCRNPADGKDYVISYNDCCGKSWCGRCGCRRDEGEKPTYYPSKSNDILWCFGTESRTYHCSFAMVVGTA